MAARAPERTQAGYRLYGAAELVQAIRIRRLRALGLTNAARGGAREEKLTALGPSCRGKSQRVRSWAPR
ncbi:MAG: hypothetical protein E6G33_14165 [Actinobacteria bacterium]|nr:MAG: hypothetical protein E6G33_14165 [Actinomycetota bacterium]